MNEVSLSKTYEGTTSRNWGWALVGGAVGMFAGALVSGPLLFAIGLYTIFNDALQSPKVDAVWDTLEPLPLMVSNPAGFALVLAILGAVHGSLFWIMEMGFRFSVETWAAQIFDETSSAPDSFMPLSLLHSTFSDIFMISTFLASSVYGLTLFKSQQFPNKRSGMVCSGLGSFWAITYAISGGPIPRMVLIVTLVMGMFPLPGQSQLQAALEKP